MTSFAFPSTIEMGILEDKLFHTYTSSFPGVIRSHEDLQGSRVRHTGQQLGKVGLW